MGWAVGRIACGVGLLIVATAVAFSAASGEVSGRTFRDCANVCPEMVVIPKGGFTMGSPDSEAGRDTDEGPQHRVSISYSLAVAKYPVTRDEFSAFVADTAYDAGNSCWGVNADHRKIEYIAGHTWRDPGFTQTGRDPVVCVNWDGAQAYVRWLDQKTGQNYRLLSEAEWEYAARAGTTTARFWGESSDGQCQYANGADQTLASSVNWVDASTAANCSDGYAFTSPVGSFSPNQFGLYDMLGNVWQWTQDCYSDSYNGAPTDGSARLGGECVLHATRGGSWHYDPRDLRSAQRNGGSAPYRGDDVGFRVARTL